MSLLALIVELLLALAKLFGMGASSNSTIKAKRLI